MLRQASGTVAVALLLALIVLSDAAAVDEHVGFAKASSGDIMLPAQHLINDGETLCGALHAVIHAQ